MFSRSLLTFNSENVYLLALIVMIKFPCRLKNNFFSEDSFLF